MTIERALELLPQMRDSEWITVLGKKTALYTDEAKEAFNIAISALKKQEADRWIPVTERLPKEDGEYLVTFESGYAEDYGLDPIGIAPFEVDCEGFGIWQERFHPVSLGSLGSEWVDIPVTAWRPLPAPYQEDDV